MTPADEGIAAARAEARQREEAEAATGRSEAIASALFDALSSADPALVAALGAEVEAHRQKYRRAGQPVATLLRKLEEAISEAAELAVEQG